MKQTFTRVTGMYPEQNYLTSDNQLTKVEENKWAFSVKGISSPEADGNVPAIKASESQSHKES